MVPPFRPKSARRTLAQLLDPPPSLPPSARRVIAAEAPYVLRGAGPSLVVLDRDYKPIGCLAELHVDYRQFPLHRFVRADLDLSADGLSHNWSGPGAELHWLWNGADVLPPHRSLPALRAYRRRLRWVFGERGLARIADLLERELGDLDLWEKPSRISCAACRGIDARGLCARCGRCDRCAQRYADGEPVGEACVECLHEEPLAAADCRTCEEPRGTP